MALYKVYIFDYDFRIEILNSNFFEITVKFKDIFNKKNAEK